MRQMRSRRVSVVAAFIALGLATAAMAQQPGQSPFEVGAQPQQRAGPAWAKPGTRAVFFEGAATIANARVKFVPGGNGAWTNAAGQSMQPEEIRGVGGGGYAVLEVGHNDADSASLTLLKYVFSDPAQGLVIPTMVQAGGAGPRFTNSPYWTDPADLARMPEQDNGVVAVVRCAYPMDGRVYRAVRLCTTTDIGGTMGTWDLDTGLLLFGSEVSFSYGSVGNTALGGTAGLAETRMSIVKLASLRDVPLPWADAPAPPWTQQVRRIEFSGTNRSVIPGAMDAGAPFGLSYTITGRGARHLAYDVRVDGAQPDPATGRPAASPMACGVGSTLGLFLPPAAFGRLRTGQVLDRDPILKTELHVLRADPQGVTIAEGNAIFRREVTYDATGMMASYRTAISAPPSASIVELRRRAAN